MKMKESFVFAEKTSRRVVQKRGEEETVQDAPDERVLGREHPVLRSRAGHEEKVERHVARAEPARHGLHLPQVRGLERRLPGQHQLESAERREGAHAGDLFGRVRPGGG